MKLVILDPLVVMALLDQRVTMVGMVQEAKLALLEPLELPDPLDLWVLLELKVTMGVMAQEAKLVLLALPDPLGPRVKAVRMVAMVLLAVMVLPDFLGATV